MTHKAHAVWRRAGKDGDPSREPSSGYAIGARSARRGPALCSGGEAIAWGGDPPGAQRALAPELKLLAVSSQDLPARNPQIRRSVQ